MSRRGPREIQVEVDTLGEDGLGRGSSNGREIRARNTLPGESAMVRVLRRRRGVWYGEADTPAVPSAQRRSAPCRVYPRCGGCVMQHVDYRTQLEHKQESLQSALAAQGVKPGRIRDPVYGPRFHYRYKARLGVRLVGDELLVGFREGFSNRVARMSDCKTLALPFARMLGELKQTLAGLSQPDRIPQVELAAGDREFAVIVRHLSALTEPDRALLFDFARRSGMQVYVQSGGYDTVVPLQHGHGQGMLSYTNPDFGLCFGFLPTDFTQVNPYVNRALVRGALLALAPEHGSRVVDLFCGIGNFSLALARLGVDVSGLEVSQGAVDRARRNAAVNGLSPWAEFAVADLYDSRCAGVEECDYLLLDPPRSGAGENLERWVDPPRLRRIAYVSCNPGSFAMDAARLAEQGFELEEVGIYDMFPHTAHVETLGLFCRRRPSATPRPLDRRG